MTSAGHCAGSDAAELSACVGAADVAQGIEAVKAKMLLGYTLDARGCASPPQSVESPLGVNPHDASHSPVPRSRHRARPARWACGARRIAWTSATWGAGKER